MKIIFCDDSEKNLKIYRNFIEKYDSPYIDAVYVNSHSELVKRCNTFSPDIIITDIFPCSLEQKVSFEMQNPEFHDGIEAVQQIKSKTDSDIYIVIISGNKELDYVIRAINAGANKYLKKPVDYELFCSVIKEKEEKIFLEISIDDAWSLRDERKAIEICDCIHKMATSYSSNDVLSFASFFKKWKEYKIAISPSFYMKYFSSTEFDFKKQLVYIESRLTELFCLTNDAGLSRKIINYVDENMFLPNMSLDMVATHFCCSSSNISMLFKNVVKMNFSKYIQEHRMTKAKKLMLTTDKSIKEIAEECGYSYSNYFIKKFVQKEGLTPSDWRKAK